MSANYLKQNREKMLVNVLTDFPPVLFNVLADKSDSYRRLESKTSCVRKDITCLTAKSVSCFFTYQLFLTVIDSEKPPPPPTGSTIQSIQKRLGFSPFSRFGLAADMEIVGSPGW